MLCTKDAIAASVPFLSKMRLIVFLILRISHAPTMYMISAANTLSPKFTILSKRSENSTEDGVVVSFSAIAASSA